jgi:hypothetical protein
MTSTQTSAFAAIASWEGEGGAVPPSLTLKGTPAQVEWAERIQLSVGEEFDRVAASLRSIALKQDAEGRADTEKIIAVIAEKREEVMRIQSAGYFIRHWQELGHQVRDLIVQDSRYEAIARERATRRRRTLAARSIVEGKSS